MAITVVDGFYCSGTNPLGNYYGSINSDKMKSNAVKIYDYFHAIGWTDAAISGMIGNMQIESTLNPGLIENGGRRYCPDNATNLSTMTNQVMLSFYKAAHPEYTGTGNPFGMGLVQWTGPNASDSVPHGQKLVAHAIRDNNTPWYYGSVQLDRIKWESQNNGQWVSRTINGTVWTWQNYITITDPQLAAHVWMVCYERPAFSTTSLNRRKNNAQLWYDYLTSSPTPPTPTEITGQYYAETAYSFRDSGYTYEQYDCIGFMNLVRTTCGIPVISPQGTNTLWRSDNLFWKGTVQEAIDEFGGIPQGALLFKIIPEGQPGYDTIPSQYRGDGVGNVTHVGIYTNLGLGVMQSGGYGGTGVHQSTLDTNYFGYVGLAVNINYEGVEPHPPGDPLQTWFIINFGRKGKNGKQIIFL